MKHARPSNLNAPPPSTRSALLAQFDGVEHAFFSARGGVSGGVYESLNCAYASSDERANIHENRRRVAHSMGLEAASLHSLKQAHTRRVVRIHKDSGPQFEQVADGMVCNHPGIGLGPLGADCAPVLYVDPVNRVIGAAHSGWKGALTGINEAVLDAMQQLGADLAHIHAAIGPAMQVAYYEVQADFLARFDDQSSVDARPSFQRREEKLYFDTPGYIRARLQAAGVRHIDDSGVDTFSNPGHYFSYRRGRAQRAPDYGRQIAVIMLSAEN